MGYRKDAIKGISWMTFLRVVTRSLTFVRLAVLGRILTPTEFGYFGIATLLLSLLEILTETGINVFLVQEKSHIKEYLNSAWVVSMIRGIILGIVIFVLAPFIANFFQVPEATNVIALMALVPLIRGFINPAIISYQKNLLFYNEFRIRSILFFVDVSISIIAGFILRSAESFTWGLIASALIEVALSYILIPLWPKMVIEIKKIQHVIRKSFWVTLTGIFLYFADNGDNLTVGKILGSASLGIYQVAYKFSTLPISEITAVVNSVTFPVFSRFSDDKPRLRNAFIKVSIGTTLGSFILGTLIFIFARPIITIFMGDQWIAAVPVVQVLVIYGVLRTLFGNFPPLFLAVGKQKYVAQLTLSRMIGLGILIIPMVSIFGMIGAGYAMLISMFFEIPLTLFFARKVLY